MDKSQAVEIQKHALDILNLVAKIELIVPAANKEERLRFGSHLGDVIMAVRFGMLGDIYELFPDLRVSDKEEKTHAAAF